MKMPATRGPEASGRSYDLIGIGLYTIPEAHRLTNVPISNIRRWTLGYAYVSGGVTHMSPAIVRPQIDSIDGTLVLGFRDLQEIRFLDAFRKHGVSWHTLRLAFERARHLRHMFPQNTKDEDWLRGLTERGEQASVVITADPQIYHNPALKAAWIESGMTVFFLKSFADFAHWEQAAKLVRWWPAIVQAASKAKPGQGFFVSVNGKVEAAKPSA